MIEIVFSESACGSLKMAQISGKGEFQDGFIGLIGTHADENMLTVKELKATLREAKEKTRLAWEKAIPMGGNTVDIYSFNLMLSIGDISESRPGILRQQALERFFFVFPHENKEQEALKMLKKINADLKTVLERTTAGESLRIWYSNQPDEICGLYWFMEQLNQWKIQKTQVFVVKLPEWETDEEGRILQKNSWGQVAPEEWYRYLALQKPAPPNFIQYSASLWQALQKEHALLRVMLNGQLVSASEKFYDEFILREISAENEVFNEVMIVGNVLSKYQLGIDAGASWIAFRIEKMVQAGTLEVVSLGSEDLPDYHRILRKCNHRE